MMIYVLDVASTGYVSTKLCTWRRGSFGALRHVILMSFWRAEEGRIAHFPTSDVSNRDFVLLSVWQ